MRQIDATGEGYLQYVELTPPRARDREEFEHLVIAVFWELVTAGIIAPGWGSSQPNLPWFRITPHGARVLAAQEYQPYDKTGYIRQLTQRVPTIDQTVLAYLAESIETFVRGNEVASMVMLGVAAERVFDLLCDALAAALNDESEQRKFGRLLERFTMKPKVDWVHAKLRDVQDTKPRPQGFPENAALMVTAIYDIMRTQRNDLGHPRELPPRLPRGDAHANLVIFPRYYETAETVRVFLKKNKV